MAAAKGRKRTKAKTKAKTAKRPAAKAAAGAKKATVKRKATAKRNVAAKKTTGRKGAAKKKTAAKSKTTRRAAPAKGGSRRAKTSKPKAAAARKTLARAKAPAHKTPAKRTAPKAAAKRKPSSKAPAARTAAPLRSAPRGVPSTRGVGHGAARTKRTARSRLGAAGSPRHTNVPVRRQRNGDLPRGVALKGALGPRYKEVLTPEALAFVADLHRAFDKTRKALMAAREAQQKRYDAGATPDFLDDTREIREGDWKVAPIPADLLDRRVEITGPVDRKMVINALNSGANVYMADFEDANSPTWSNNVEGQINLKDRWAGTLAFTDTERGKDYALGANPAVLVVRPRGWHLVEEHMTVDGAPVSGALFDFGLYFFHNAQAQIAQGTAPYFYLPKLETHQEARLWNDVFLRAQERLGIPAGTIKATVLIETLPAAFEMDEILWELRDHAAGLNAGRWDYIFSFIKKLAKHPDDVLPDRSQVVMGKAFLGAYAALLVKTCHRRGAFAMGGMAAQIPVRGDEAANRAAFDKVRADKEREANDGHDGTWVAHPDLVPVAKEVFDRLMPQPNQLDKLRNDVHVTRDDLLKIHDGTKTEEGFRHNIRVGVQYVEAWLGGRGAVPIYNLMEDAATAEISRAQIWQWIKYGVELDTGVTATPELFRRAMQEEMQRVKWEIGAEAYDNGRFPEAIKLFSQLSLAPEFSDFLTIPAYKLIV
ncbi:MAG: malate synthase A [Variibacter sp.]